MRISKTGGTATNDQIKRLDRNVVLRRDAQGGGRYQRCHPLAYNDKFILFKNGAGNYGVISFATTNLPTPPVGLKWDVSGPLWDGSILVVYDNQATTPTIDPGSGSFVGSPSVAISPTPARRSYTPWMAAPEQFVSQRGQPVDCGYPDGCHHRSQSHRHQSRCGGQPHGFRKPQCCYNADLDQPYGRLLTTAANWSNSVVATGTNVTADFSKLTLSAATAVTLDGARPSAISPETWATPTADVDTEAPALSLAVTSGSPTVNVVNQSATVNTVSPGSTGPTRTGSGLLTLGAPTPMRGNGVVNNGALRLLERWSRCGDRGSVGRSTPGRTCDYQRSMRWVMRHHRHNRHQRQCRQWQRIQRNVWRSGYFTTHNLTGGRMQGGSGWWISAQPLTVASTVWPVPTLRLFRGTLLEG